MKKADKKKKSEKKAPETLDSRIGAGSNGHHQTEYGLIKLQSISEEMSSSYLDYAMSVIVARALPDVRDGLKPVHRRILYAMWDIGLRPTAKFRKSATVVGEVLGKYHPHGDLAVYDSMVRLAQDFSMRYPLVKGQGNFGSMDGDGAAAMRYCLSGDSLLLSNRGLLEISSLSKKSEDKINLGVLNYEGRKKKAVKFFDSGRHPILKITTALGYEIKGSYNHPVLLWDRDEFGRPYLYWKTLSDLQRGDCAVLNRGFSLFSSKDSLLEGSGPKKMSQDLAFLLGALLSGGHNRQGRIFFRASNPDFYRRVKKIILKLFPQIILVEKGLEFSFNQIQVLSFLKKAGYSLKTPEIPWSVLLSRRQVIASFLQALFEAGALIKRSAGKSVEISYQSSSRKLISQLKILLLNFSIATASSKSGLLISGRENVRTFIDQINLFSPLRKKTLSSSLRSGSSQAELIPVLGDYLKKKGCWKSSSITYHDLAKQRDRFKKLVSSADLKLIDDLLKSRYLFDRIDRIEPQAKKEKVYSVKVDSSCHSFVANGFINHNTEAKLAHITEELIFDLDKDTVDFIPNYDGSQQEPKVLPAKLPNLLLNGCMGIAVGMSTNIPPHNLKELVGAINLLLEKPESTVEDLMQFITGPDFPTGGIVYDRQDILNAYATGRGGIVCRGRAEIKEDKNGNFQIIITELPFQVNKAVLVEKIADLVKDKKLEGVKNLRDESDKEGVRVVLDLKKDSYPKKILNSLYKNTALQSTFHVNMLALIDGLQPKVLTLKMVLEEYIKHRIIVVQRRTEFELAKAKDRAHILAGLMIALKNIDEVIKTIKASKDKDSARENLIKKFKLSERQAVAILEMKLQSLANLERTKIENELKEKLKLIQDLESILASKLKIIKIIKEEVRELGEKFGDERRTQVVVQGLKNFNAEDLVPNEEAMVMMTRDGYIKRLDPNIFKVQARGGKGVIGLSTKEEDLVEFMFSTQTHDDILFFTTRGRVFQMKAYEIPSSSRTAKGTPIVNFLQLIGGEKITSILPLDKISSYNYLFFATEQGLVKKVKTSALANVRRSGLIAIKIKNDDKLIWCKPTSGSDHISLITANGQAIRFAEKEVRDMGRNAAGVRGIKLKAKDIVVGMGVIATDKDIKRHYQILTIMSRGYGKRSDLNLYKLQGRGGSGIRTAKVSAKSGPISNAFVLNKDIMNDRDLIIISGQGQVIRLPFKSVNELGRDTQGVRIMRFKEEGDGVSSVTYV